MGKSATLSKFLNEEDTIRVVYKGKEYFYSGSGAWQERLLEDLERGLIFEAEVPGVSERCFGIAQQGRRRVYPPLFESFWRAYHPERRIGKVQTYNEWKKLSDTDKSILPNAARAYTQSIRIETEPKYMRYPERFISLRLFEDYEEKEDESEVIEGIEYWKSIFRSATGRYPETLSGDRGDIRDDIKSMGYKRWHSNIDVYFKGGVTEIERVIKEDGFSYKGFRKILNTVLSKQRFRNADLCPYCGGFGKHANNCPTTVREQARRARERKEIDEGRENGLSIEKAFKDSLRAKRAGVEGSVREDKG